MRIQHNIAAMNSYRNYNNNTNALSKNLEKLSSGYKINRAGDDAAGLAISEKMRAQITGLETASKNVKDGISLVKTAEGALQEVHDMLNRMEELATQSANGTYDNEVDRANLQKEVDALKTEINRIADSSNFNGIKLLDGSLASTGSSSAAPVSGEKSAIVESSLANVSLKTNQTGVATAAGVYTATIKAAGTAAATATQAIKFNVTYIDADGKEQSKTLYTAALSASAQTDGKIAKKLQAAITADSDLSKLFTAATAAGGKIDFTAIKGGTNGAQVTGLNIVGLVKATDHETAVAAPTVLTGGAQAVDVTTVAKDGTKINKIDFASDAPVAGTTVTVGDKTYEFVAANGDVFSVAEGNIAVVVGTSASKSIGNLAEALKANGVTSAKFATGNTYIEIGDLEQIKAVKNMADIQTSNKDGVIIAPKTADKAEAQFTVGAGSGKKTTMEITYINADGEEKTASISYTSDTTVATNATNIKTALAANEELNNLFTITTGSNGKVTIEAKVAGEGKGSVVGVKSNDVDVDSIKGFQNTRDGRDAGQSIALDVTKMANGDTLTIEGKTFQFVDSDKLDTVKEGNVAVILDKSSTANTAVNLNLALKQNNMNVDFNAATNSFFIANEKNVGGSTGGLTLQIGDTAESFNQMNVQVEDMHAEALGVADLSVADQESAAASIDKIKDAINSVSMTRGTLGATQNRLEHTAKNLSVMTENIQDAESSIRDTDVAAEMMEYTKNNILLQSAQAMLAQANQMPQGVLQLLG